MHGPDSDVDNGVREERERSYHGRHREEDQLLGPASRRGLAWPATVALILAVIALSGLGYVVNSVYRGQPKLPAPVDAAALDRTDEPAARSLDRSDSPTPSVETEAVPTLEPSPAASARSRVPASPSPSPTPRKRTTSRPAVKASPSVKPSPTKSRPPAPVGGLDQQQMNNAATIVKVGQQRDMPKRAYVIAIATALQESYLRNLANGNLPESLSLSNEGVGYDHDSVGLFQQRPSTGWGTVAECMTPSYAAGMFYERLALVFGWETMSLAAAAQAVQVSAFPDAYAKHEANATTVVQALLV
jgi:hypothetical protein